jgi:hypothetical protein
VSIWEIKPSEDALPGKLKSKPQDDIINKDNKIEELKALLGESGLY